MKKYIAFSLLLMCCNFCCADVITGEIEKQGQSSLHTVYDMSTNVPLEGVVIKIPAKNYKTKTNKNGVFSLNTNIELTIVYVHNKNAIVNNTFPIIPPMYVKSFNTIGSDFNITTANKKAIKVTTNPI